MYFKIKQHNEENIKIILMFPQIVTNETTFSFLCIKLQKINIKCREIYTNISCISSFKTQNLVSGLWIAFCKSILNSW